MTKLFLIISLVLTVYSCRQSSENNSDIFLKFKPDTSIFSILKVDTSLSDFKGAVQDSTFNPDNKDLQKIEFLLSQAINDYNKKGAIKKFDELKRTYDSAQVKLESVIINLNEYKRQYIGLVSSGGRGEKLVYINCFRQIDDQLPHPSFNWRKELVLADGGGINHFHVNISLGDLNYSDFTVNPLE